MARIGRDPTTTVYAAADGRGRDDNNALSLRIGTIPRVIHTQLVLPLFFRRLRRPNTMGRWHCPNCTIFGFLLDILYEVNTSFSSSIHTSLCANTSPEFCRGKDSISPYDVGCRARFGLHESIAMYRYVLPRHRSS